MSNARVPLIELRDVTRSHPMAGGMLPVLKGVSLSIEHGEFVAILGQSGSGKTTLMNLIGCLDTPTSGTYRFEGQPVDALDRDERAALRREAFGFVFQRYNLLPSASARENVEIPALYAGAPPGERASRAQALLARLGLADRLDHRPGELSGGQQQRIAVARALMNGGRVILADEPTGALDTASGEEVMAIFEELHREGHTVILVTHDRDLAARAHRRIELRDGRVVADSGTLASRTPGAAAAIASDGQHSVASSPAAPAAADRTAPWRGGRSRGARVFGWESARMALRSLGAHPLRSLLTLLGIVIGVGSVVAMLALGDGSKAAVLGRLDAMGTDLLLVKPGARGVRVKGESVTLVPEDAVALAGLPRVRAAVPEYTAGATLRAAAVDYVSRVTGTTADLPAARQWGLASGAFFTDADEASHAPVAVLGASVRSNLFPGGEDPVGSRVLINNVPFLVIGVLQAKGASASGSDMDDVVFVPFGTARMRLFGKRHAHAILVQVDDVRAMTDTQREITAVLEQRHGRVDFQVRNMADLLEAASDAQDTFSMLLGSIAAISLLVGGIGVMNIMLVSVSERTREIGIRMAAGARMAHILVQFNTEALVLCSLGGVIGVGAGLAGAWVAGAFGHPVVYSTTAPLLAFTSAWLTGLVFGYLPARKAAALDPVAALSAT